MKKVFFASSNKDKYQEVMASLKFYGIEAQFANISPIEIQSNSLEEIAREKSKSAFSLFSFPLIVEDDGLFIYGLNGFPGPYSSYVFKTLGIDGIIKLMNDFTDRSAAFESVIAYYDGSKHATFSGQIQGTISLQPKGGGWGYDPIFIPQSSALTFGQLSLDNSKTKYSHRARALDKFARWFSPDNLPKRT
jgi:XTP/dITP diphosphohydrolase